MILGPIDSLSTLSATHQRAHVCFCSVLLISNCLLRGPLQICICGRGSDRVWLHWPALKLSIKCCRWRRTCTWQVNNSKCNVGMAVNTKTSHELCTAIISGEQCYCAVLKISRFIATSVASIQPNVHEDSMHVCACHVKDFPASDSNQSQHEHPHLSSVCIKFSRKEGKFSLLPHDSHLF